ncbi:hypothetical protein BC834DRAFT_888081 [Gloeopeniophorella convolvens]|nr:hypothetical protein BC834DRAFT_888081 [Gloeopeniophorella convolvens]
MPRKISVARRTPCRPVPPGRRLTQFVAGVLEVELSTARHWLGASKALYRRYYSQREVRYEVVLNREYT